MIFGIETPQAAKYLRMLLAYPDQAAASNELSS